LSEEHATAFAGTPHFIEMVNLFLKDSFVQQSETQAVRNELGLPASDTANEVAIEEATIALQAQVADHTLRLRSALDAERQLLESKLAEAQSCLQKLELERADVGYRNI
jgi:hypothetical protein